MTDYVFLDVNKAFETHTGLKRADVLNKRFVRDISTEKEEADAWVARYAAVFDKAETTLFEDYSKEFRRHYAVLAAPVGDGCFVTWFSDKTFEANMHQIVRYVVDFMGEAPDYDKLTRFAHDITGAKVAVLNLPNDRQGSFATVALCADPGLIKKGTSLLDFDLVGKAWCANVRQPGFFKGGDAVFFDDIEDCISDALPKQTVANLKEVLGVQGGAVVKISKGQKAIGDLMLFFKPGATLKNNSLFELYCAQLGLFLEKTRLEQTLKASQNRFFTLAEHAPVGFASCDENGAVTYANPSLLAILGSPSYTATAQFNLLTLPGLVESGFSRKLAQCLNENRQITYEMGYRSMWGKNTWLRVHFAPYCENNKTTGANIVAVDITERKAEEDALREKAHRDPLTGAYNRNALDTLLADKLESTMREKLVSALALLDLDNFKIINDHFGHLAGDGVLTTLVDRLMDELWPTDLLIRTGGDEFLIYLHDVENRQNAHSILSRLQVIITKPAAVTIPGTGEPRENALPQQQSILALCSMGACLCPQDGATLRTLIAKADKALYAAKAAGKANLRFWEDCAEAEQG